MRALIITGLALFLPTPAAAQIVDRHADGFTLRYADTVEVGRGDVAMAVEAMGAWWDGDHTYTGSAANLSLDPRVGGCFCEAMPDGSMFEHGRITALDDDHLVLDAPLGPLKGMATRAELTFTWPDTASRTHDETGVVMVFVVQGPGLGAFADAVDQVMGGQHARLLHLIEHGTPEPEQAD
jgi:hypothetical protein